MTGARAPRFALEARRLARPYGALMAVADFSLAVPSGAVYGLIGPNGAGRTTSLRMLATLLPPSDGKAWIAGVSITRESRQVRRMPGYMPDFFGVYPELKIWQYLDFYAACHDVPCERRSRICADLLGQADRLRDLLANRPGVHAIRLEDADVGPPDVGEVGGAVPDARGLGDDTPRGIRFVLEGDERALQRLLADLLQAALPIYSFTRESPGLEYTFLRVTARAVSDEG